jgi:LmbE family N-acetylglucosaminyl deacetylase
VKRILVVVAHADDETLGCGGTIARHVANGDEVGVVFMTDGVSSRDAGDNITACEVRSSAADLALDVLGVKDRFKFRFPDNKMDSVPLLDVVQSLESILEKYQAEVIYTHFSHDLNIDHRITNQAVLTACRPQKCCPVKEIYSFEVVSATEWNSKSSSQFMAQKIVDIEFFWDKKLAALKCYSDELRPYPHSRSLECVEAQSILRGCQYGFKKAEAFFVERIIS